MNIEGQNKRYCLLEKRTDCFVFFFGNLTAQVGQRALESYTADFLADAELSLLPLAAH